MVKFQEERSRIGDFTMKMLIEGKILFGVLELQAVTPELRALAGSYRKHLELKFSEQSRK
jgi:hypothetical protein